jgi:hypothetical protein
MPKDSMFPKIKGFDPTGEPELRRAENGGLKLVFSTMPPTTRSGEARDPHLFDDFERVLSAALLTTVLRDDRERFLLPEPDPETATKLARYLSEFWTQHGQPLRVELGGGAPADKTVFRNEMEFREAMRDVVEPLLKPHGFRTSISQLLSFKRKFKGGYDLVRVFADGRNDVTRAEPCVSYGVQHFTLERLVAICCETEKKHLKHKESSGTHHVVMPPGAPVVSTPATAAAWIRVCGEDIERQVLSGLNEWRDLDAISAALNDLNGGTENYDRTPSSYQYYGARGVLLAKLLGDPRLEDIIAFHAPFTRIDDDANYFQIYLNRCFSKACELARTRSVTELQAMADAF